MSSLLAARAPRWAPSDRSDGSPFAREFSLRVRPHLDELVRSAQAIVGSEDLAWDAVQVVLVRLWDRRSLPDDTLPVLRHLVRKSALQTLRTERRRQRAETLACPVCGEDLEWHAPFDDAHYEELQELIRSALDALPDEQRRVVELCLLEGYEYAAAARFEGVPVGTIRSRVHRARRVLQERLRPELGAADRGER